MICFKFKHNKDFVKNATTLTAGTTIAQVVNLILYPALGRIYSVDEFAGLSILMSITSILSVIATGKYEFSIITTSSKIEALNVSILSIGLSVILMSLLSLIAILCPTIFNFIFRISDASYYILLASICTVAIVVFNVFNEWCVYNKYYKSLSYNKINNSLAVSLSKLFLGLTPYSLNGLVYGDLLGRWLSALGCNWRFLKRDKTLLKCVSRTEIIRLIKRYINFPKYVMPAQLLNVLATSIPVFFIGRHYTSIELGYYSMAMNVLVLPISLISVSLRDVFRKKAAEIFSETGDCRKLFIGIFKPLCAIGFLILITTYYFVPDAFALVLGEKWRMAGKYAQILMFFIYFDFVAMVFSAILMVVEKTRELLKWQIVHLTLTVISLYITLFWHGTMQSLLISFTAGRTISYIYLLCLSYKNSKI